MESDTDTMSPANIKSNQLCLPRTSDMCYLSPFSSVSRGDRTISDESNLSSSGYSSMASPAPSRVSSRDPLFPTMNDTDDNGGGVGGSGGGGGGGSGISGSSGGNNKFRKMRSNSMQSGKSSDNNSYANCSKICSPINQFNRNQLRSNSETLSDDVLLESNDEGIETDHIDEKLDSSQMECTPNELEHCIPEELIDSGKKILCEEQQQQQQLIMSKLQLPTIVIQNDGTDKSPVSSRSESPIRYLSIISLQKCNIHKINLRSFVSFSNICFSERASGSKRFSPQFYNNRKEQILPFTDSDGLYDFPSSDGKGHSTNEPSTCKRNSTRKRERKLSRGGSY